MDLNEVEKKESHESEEECASSISSVFKAPTVDPPIKFDVKESINETELNSSSFIEYNNEKEIPPDGQSSIQKQSDGELICEENKVDAGDGEVEIQDKFLTSDAAESESVQDKCDVEPMDIDEILDILNTAQGAGEEISNAPTDKEHIDELKPSKNDKTHLNDSGNEINEENVGLCVSKDVVESNEGQSAEIDASAADPKQSQIELIDNSIDEALNIVEDDISMQEENADQQPDQNALETVNENTGIDLIKTIHVSESEENNIDEVVTIDSAGQNHRIERSNESDDCKMLETGTTKSVDVFDLLLENEEFFAGADDIDEAKKSDEIKDMDIAEKSVVSEVKENLQHITECANVETVPLEKAEIQSTQDEEQQFLQELEYKPEQQTELEQQLEPLKEETLKTVETYVLRRDCLNINCSKKSNEFYDAPEFVINHFHLNKRSKTMHICDECYDHVIEMYGELCAALKDKQPLFLEKIKYSDLVEIIDSSDEENDDETTNEHENNQQFDKETLELIENELENVINETMKNVDIDQQMDWNRQILKAQVQKNERNCAEMMKEMQSLQRRIDKLYTNTYGLRHTFVEEVQSLDLTDMKPTQICNENYPPAGDLKHSDIEYNTMYYTFRSKLISRWLPCKVTNKVEINGQTEYTVRFCREKRDSATNIKTIPRKHLAYGRAPEYRLNIGTRVIALFDNNSADSITKEKLMPLRNNFYPGIIAEPLSLYTNWRYLVFFDDGYVQYVNHENVRVVCECTENVWELIEEPGAKTFIEGYVKEFKKKRPIVQVRKGQRIQTEVNGKWFNAIVNNEDGSLVQVFFEETKRYEWIYRGSTRLFPLYKKLKHITMPGNRNEATIEYIVIDDEKEPQRSTEPPVEEMSQPKTPPSKAIQRTFASQAVRDTPLQKQREQKRAVAKKSTVPQPKPAIQHMNNSTIYVDEDKPKGKVVYYTAKKHIDVKKYLNHECQPSCLCQVHHNLSTYSPLSKPLLSGFERQICKTRFNKKFVVYRAPCGRRLRDMPEMHKYLRMTNCKLNVENFTFDPLIHCLAEYVIESCVLKKADLSGGIEKMPVQLVNCYDNTMPPPCTYSAKRIPTEGVNLNCDSDFLCGCDCTDDCLDKSKCACWNLTLQGAKYGNPDTPIEDVGYQYKRLNEPVPTGIYECNSRCKCKANCLNRVVQHPLQLKLQVFKTVNRGWGLRCLNDVPKGSFICCYAGNLLTETSANEAGGELGDEYFAELDYIEVVENMKEGYEPEVINDDNDSTGTDEDFDVEMESMRSRNDDSDDEFVARSYTASEDSESRRYRTRNSVDTRKKPEQTGKRNDLEKRRERNSSSDDDGDGVRQVKNFMASNTMPLNEDADDERNKSIRKFFGQGESVYIMDAKKAGNIGRYFNHSCGPNLFVQNVFVDTHDLRFPWVAFFASTHIRAGTELTWNYNYEVGSVPGKVLICQCGDEKCRGRIL